MTKRLKIFTWNIHGGFLGELSRIGHEFYFPYKPDRPYNYAGAPTDDHAYIAGKPNPSTKSRGKWAPNIHEISVKEIKRLRFDIIIIHTYQQAWEEQYKVLSPSQLRVPKIMVFHTPPWLKDFRPKPEKRKKLARELPKIDRIVHITDYNCREWTKALSLVTKRLPPVEVIYHGIPVDERIRWNGRISKGITAINYLMDRPDCGRIHWRRMAARVPIELAGAGSEPFGGLGMINHSRIRSEFAKYRLYYNPTNRSSLPMSMLEAMSVGLPIVARRSTDIPNVIKHGHNGFVSEYPEELARRARQLLGSKSLARELGKNAQQTIVSHFSPARFAAQWNRLLENVVAGATDSGPE